MILGGVETRLLELVAAYGAFGNGGVAMPWRARRDEAPVPRRLFEPRAAWLTWHMLAAGEEGFAFKTGTSHSFRDAWALGVNGRIALGVWLGRPDGAPVAGLEGSVALALARTIAASLPPGLRGAPPRPPGIVEETVCWPLGRPPAETPPGLCHRIRRGLAIAGRLPPTLPERLAPRLGARIETALVDRGTGLRVEPACGRSVRHRPACRSRAGRPAPCPGSTRSFAAVPRLRPGRRAASAKPVAGWRSRAWRRRAASPGRSSAAARASRCARSAPRSG
ncbi:MAG: hypothetical protein RML12_08700 [Xanthomonadales bacterium]|nr:hypothetical protein [Xanthomonadales bacterium]